MTPNEVLKMAKDQGVKMVDLRFMDFPACGNISAFRYPSSTKAILKSAMALTVPVSAAGSPFTPVTCWSFPIPRTAKIDPFFKESTLVLICDIVDPVTHEPYSRDPRNIAKKAEAYLKSTGIGDTAFIGPEAEFFIFDDIRFDPSATWRSTRSTV